MAAALKVLIILGGLVSFGAVARAEGPRCLQCHPPHHETSGSCTRCHRGDERTSRKNIAHRNLIPGRYAHFNLPHSPHVERGKAMLKTFGCRRCHVTGGEGNRLAADLDDRLSVSSAERVAKAIGQPGWFMPDFRFSETQIGDLVNALFAEGRKGDDRRKEPSIVIHFEADGRSEEPRFVERCGPCHKILSQRYGAMGKGDIGPNLSGLFTEHYPWTFKEHERWSPENLSEWLKNPRRIRPPAMMQPVILKAEEMIELCGVIALEAGETAPHPP